MIFLLRICYVGRDVENLPLVPPLLCERNPASLSRDLRPRNPKYLKPWTLKNNWTLRLFAVLRAPGWHDTNCVPCESSRGEDFAIDSWEGKGLQWMRVGKITCPSKPRRILHPKTRSLPTLGFGKRSSFWARLSTLALSRRSISLPSITTISLSRRRLEYDFWAHFFIFQAFGVSMCRNFLQCLCVLNFWYEWFALFQVTIYDGTTGEVKKTISRFSDVVGIWTCRFFSYDRIGSA